MKTIGYFAFIIDTRIQGNKTALVFGGRNYHRWIIVDKCGKC